jgi:membrane protein YqaA with SNARE-associated domain
MAAPYWFAALVLVMSFATPLVRTSKRSSGLTSRLRLDRLLRRVADYTQRHPEQLATLVVASALVGLPPLAVVAPLAGAAAMRRNLFFAYGFAGRLTRFSALALAPFVMR